MSKQTKRKITVEVATKTSEQPKSRPSVFERLGTKTTTTSSQSNEYCRHWSQNGTCPYGKSCKYASTHTLTSPSKRAAKKDEQKKQNRTAAPSKDDPNLNPNKRLHSTIVKALRSPEPEWEQWNQTDLEDADAEMLEKRRQELQRELELQMKMESKLTKTKEKTNSVKKGSSSSSSNSSSSSTESSSSSEETSSTSSSTSLDSRSRKAKRTKGKRDSSSSTEPERRKKKATSKTGHKHSSSASNNVKITEKKKTLSPALKSSTTKPIKSPSPPRSNRRLSQTPPLKSSKVASSMKTPNANKPSSRSPRSQSQTERKEKHRTPSPSPKLPSSASASARERERERDRERVKEKDRAREKEREKTREKERERDNKDKIREKEKSREREKVRERDRDHNNGKTNSSRSPKRANSRQSRDVQKKKESPTDMRSKATVGVGDAQKSRSANTNNNTTSSKRDISTNKNSPATSSKDRNRDEDKKKDDRERRDRDRDRDRDRERDVKDRSMERKKDKEKEKEKEKRVERDDLSRRDRDRERERRMTREEREAAREKEREEALARCQERQRERERLKELAKKERESIPSLLHINTGAGTNASRLRERDRERDRDRDRDRERERDRGLDKPPADRVERLLPLPADRIPPMRKELERQAARSQDRTSNRSDRNRSTNRGGVGSGGGGGGGAGREREADRVPNFDYRESRERERDRDFPALGARAPREERRHDEKNYDSPYRRDERPPYLELEHEHYENPREREYPEERRGSRRDAWDSRDIIEPELVMDEERRRGYGRGERDEVRPSSSSMKERTWENPDYTNRAEWERNRRPAIGAAHEWPEDWEPTDHNSMEEEWRHYNRSMDSWPSDERRRWPQDFPERRPGPTSTSSHRDADEHLDAALPVVEEIKKDTILGKRIAEPAEDLPEVKKPCVALEDSNILEDALSEISDDADEILNREDEPVLEQSKDILIEDVATVAPSLIERGERETEEAEVKIESPTQVHTSHDQENEEDGIDEDGIDNMDFEEISDEELEEEVKVKGLGDALGVDWASLVAESRPRPKQDKAGSAKKRWEYYNVLSRIGVSLEMAGEEIVQEILTTSSKKDSDDANDEDETITTKSQCKYNEIGAIQVAGHEKTLVRNNLFASAGPHRRALSARRDLQIRRHLCNLPILDRPTHTTPPTDPHFYQTVLNTIITKLNK